MTPPKKEKAGAPFGDAPEGWFFQTKSPLRVTIDPIAKQRAKFHGVFDRAYFNHRLKGPPGDAHGRQPRFALWSSVAQQLFGAPALGHPALHVTLTPRHPLHAQPHRGRERPGSDSPVDF